MGNERVAFATDAQAQNTADNSRSKQRFWLRLLIFVLPFSLGFITFTGTLIYSGESMPLALVVAMQQGDDPVLYRPLYGNRDFGYKLLATNTRRPDILAVGSSRVLQFRSMFFNLNSEAFYNAGAPAWYLERVHQFVRSIDPDALPDILIIGLDQPWFNDDFQRNLFELEVNDFAQIFGVNRSVLQDLLTGESQLDFSRLLSRTENGYGAFALGTRAIMDGQGFRNDGSEQFGDFFVAGHLAPDLERNRHLELMRNGEEMYVRGDTVSQSALAELEALLTFCREHNIYVIGFFPPFAPTLYNEMVAGGQHTYIPQASTLISEIFTRYGFSYFDFTNIEGIGGDGDFFDGWHASERVHLQMYIRMVETLPDLLLPYSDLQFLYQNVIEATDTFQVFHNQF